MHDYNWIEKPHADRDTIDSLSNEFDIPPAAARLLASRELVDPRVVRDYLEPSPAHEHDPFAFEFMERAVETIQEAIGGKRSVLIHGDYDVDGISGTALLYHYLGGLFEQVSRFVPDRRKDGYGLAERAVKWALAEGIGLFISVDCGTSDTELIGRLEDAGVDVIVCDHHEFPVGGEYRGVMLNPVREGERYPFRSLCGTGVAYKLIEALDKRGIRGNHRPEALIDLTAIATIGDVAPLIGENRYLVRAGLEAMNESPRPAIEAMRGFARVGSNRITSTHIAFGFAPRINAPGRVSNPKPSLEILCEERRDNAQRLAAVLENDNDRRKELTQIVHGEAVALISKLEDRDHSGAFVLAAEGWDEGVLGIAAARVVEEFGRPALLLAISGDTAKGSGRSVPAVNLKDQMDHFRDSFIRYGGHSQAVGVTMKADAVEGFARDLDLRLRETVGLSTGRSLHIDASLDVDECSMELLSFLSKCEPFGHGNKTPVWKISDVLVSKDTTLVGSGQGHLKLFFTDTRGNPGEAIKFGWEGPETPDDLHGRAVDIVVTLKRGSYMGRDYPELRILDIRTI